MPEMTLENVDPLTARVFLAFRNAAQVHRQLMMKKMAQDGGHHWEAFCLRLVAHHDGISQRDLASKLHLSRPWITKMLQSLEKAGMVTRRADEHDQRITRVYLTPEGRVREAGLRAAWAEYLNQTIGSLSEEDRLQLERLGNQLADRISGMMAAMSEPSDQPGGAGEPAGPGEPGGHAAELGA
jgi:DNA-binding MarR family transcriptional regulator